MSAMAAAPSSVWGASDAQNRLRLATGRNRGLGPRRMEAVDVSKAARDSNLETAVAASRTYRKCGISDCIPGRRLSASAHVRSEEHTSELQSRLHLVCRLLLEKKKTRHQSTAR